MDELNLLSCFDMNGLVLLSVGMRRRRRWRRWRMRVGVWLVCWLGAGGSAARCLLHHWGLARGLCSHHSPLPSLSFNSRYCSSTRPCLFLPKQALLCFPPPNHHHPTGKAWEFICLGTTHPSLPACTDPPPCVPERSKYAYIF